MDLSGNSLHNLGLITKKKKPKEIQSALMPAELKLQMHVNPRARRPGRQHNGSNPEVVSKLCLCSSLLEILSKIKTPGVFFSYISEGV